MLPYSRRPNGVALQLRTRPRSRAEAPESRPRAYHGPGSPRVRPSAASALMMPDDYASEERSVTVGMDALGRVLVVVYTWRDDEPRLISARKANRTERRQYESKR